MSKRERIASWLDGIRTFNGAMTLRRHLPGQVLTVVTYHRIADPSIAVDCDTGVIDARPDEFRRQLTFVKKTCSIISLDTLRRHLRNGEKLPPNPALVTFDDGYLDNYKVALPILKDLGISATFFIATSFIDQRKMFWWDKLHALLRRAERLRFSIDYPTRTELDLGSIDAKNTSVRRLLGLIKDTYDLDLDRFFAEIATAGEATLTTEEERTLVESLMMTWDQIRDLADAGMSVQSHTRDHFVLQTVPIDRVKSDLAESKARVEKELGREVFALAFPVGRSLKDVPQVQEAIRNAGYEMAFSNCGGASTLRNFDRYEIRRMGFDAGTPDSVFRGQIAFPIEHR